MATKNFTADTAAKAQPASKRYWLWSKSQKGFGLSVQPSGAKAYYFVTRVDGRQHFSRIAAFGEVEFAAALGIATELAGQAARARAVEGATYQPAKLVKPAEVEAPLLMSEVWAVYVREHLKRTRSCDDVQAKLDRHAGPLLSQPVADIDGETVRLWLRDLPPVTGKHCVQALRAACNFAAKHPRLTRWPHALANPFARIELAKPNPRSRKLEGRDLKGFALAAAKHPDLAVQAFTLGLLVSGARLNELREARVSEWDGKRRRLRLAANRMKSDKPGVLTFGPVTATLIERLAHGKAPGAAIFAGDDPQGCRDFRKPWLALCKAAGVEDYTFHDARRTSAGALVAAGFDGLVVEQHLNHAPPLLQKSYLTLDADAPKRDEMAAAIEVALGLKPAAKATEKAQARRAA